MNRSLPFALALAAVACVPSLPAQAPAAGAPAAAAPASVAPQAIPSKVAIIAFTAAVVNTNEGQRAVADIQKKYAPQKGKIDGQAAEITSLRQQLQALPASTPDEERAGREKSLDAKEKQLQLDEETASNSYQTDLQQAYGKVAQKVGQTAVKYSQDNGFTLMLNMTSEQQAPSPILWFAQTTDITQAVVNAYNASSGIAPPPPSAPAPAARRTAPPATTAPHK